MSPAPWLIETKEGIVIALYVQTGAKRSELIGTHGDALKIKISGPVVDQKINAEMLRYIARKVGAPAADVTLVYGETGLDKQVNIVGKSVPEVFEKLISW